MAVENDKGVMVTGEEGRVGEVEGCGNGYAVVAEMGVPTICGLVLFCFPF